MKKIYITSNDKNQRLDKFLKKFFPNAPATFIYKGLRKKDIKVNGGKVEGSYILKEKDEVSVYLHEDKFLEFQGQEKKEVSKAKMEFEVVYEDENILLVNKPAGLLSHPDEPHQKDTLIDQIIYYLYQRKEFIPNSSTFTPALCNRLDRNTSGLVLAAKNFVVLQEMNQLIKEKKVDKFYLSIVKGKIEKECTIKGYLLKDERTNQVKIIGSPERDAKYIETRYRPMKNMQNYTLLEIQLITGRSHQIRAHLASIGHPLIGDVKYGDPRINQEFKKLGLSHQFLHGYKLIFRDLPLDLEYLKNKSFEAPLPKELLKIEKCIFGKEMNTMEGVK